MDSIWIFGGWWGIPGNRSSSGEGSAEVFTVSDSVTTGSSGKGNGDNLPNIPALAGAGFEIPVSLPCSNNHSLPVWNVSLTYFDVEKIGYKCYDTDSACRVLCCRNTFMPYKRWYLKGEVISIIKTSVLFVCAMDTAGYWYGNVNGGCSGLLWLWVWLLGKYICIIN